MLQIKICSGLQEGALVECEVKEHLIIGNTSECEVFIFGEKTADYKCKFTKIDNEFLRLDSTDGANVYLANGQQLLVGQQINSNASFIINDSKLLMGNNLTGKSWGYELANLKSLESLENTNEYSDTMTDDLNSFDNSYTDDFADEVANNSKDGKLANSADNKNKSTSGKLKNKMFANLKIKPAIKKYLLILMVTFLLMTGCIVYISLSASNTQFSTTNDTSQLDLLNKQVDKLPEKYADLILTNEGNNITISGVVASTGDIDFIKHYFANFKTLKITYKLITYPEAKNIITTILNKYNLKNIIINYDSNQGSLALSGVIDNYDKLSDAEIDINNGLPSGVDVNTSELFDSTVVTKDFLSYISFLGKDQLSITYDYSVPVINADGYLDDKTLIQLQVKINEFKNKYSVITVNLNISKLAQVLPFQISMVYAGSPAYIVTSTGEKVFVGGTIKGLTLVSVSNTTVQFMGKYPIVINLQDLDSWGNSVPAPEIGRSQVLSQELKKIKDSITKEQASLARIQNLIKNVKESDVIVSLKVEADNLAQDIELKQHELTAYSKGKK